MENTLFNAVFFRPFLRLGRDIQFQRYAQAPSEKGLVWLFLKMKTPATKEIMSDVAYVTGQFVIYEEKSSFAGTIMPVQGVFLRHLGQLTLFGNSPDATVQLLYKKPTSSHVNGSTINTTRPLPKQESNRLTSRHKSREKNDFSFGIPKIHQPEDYEALNISPPRYSFVTRFRSSDTFSDQCLSVIKLQLKNESSSIHKRKVAATSKESKVGDSETYEDMLRSMQFTGTLASENCGLYLSLQVSFEKKNLDKFFSKASHYAILMTVVSMAEIYFVLRQLQASSTQATAAKVSLLTIGQQAILDSYLCLAHLTVGIIAQVHSLYLRTGISHSLLCRMYSPRSRLSPLSNSSFFLFSKCDIYWLYGKRGVLRASRRDGLYYVENSPHYILDFIYHYCLD